MAKPRSLSPLLLVIIALVNLFNSAIRASGSTPTTSNPTTYSVVDFGAKPDGETESSAAFLAAWGRACTSLKVGSIIYVPNGRFYIRSMVFNGPCKNSGITVRIAGTLVASSDYRVIGSTSNWIKFEHVNGVTVSGGTLDGQGTSLWACKNSGRGSCPTGATSLEFSNSQNVAVNGLASVNSQLFHIAVINGCTNVKMQGVHVRASGNSPNTDGIHVQSSSSVTILNSNIGTGDDCISVGPGTTNLWIESVSCGPGHGISIGSLGKDLNEAGVKNVTVKSTTFTGTKNGMRIKSWGRASNGFASGILFQHAVMNDVENAIVIDQNYCPNNKGCPGQVSGVKIRDVTYEDIHGTSATQVAIKFDCSRAYPCTGIKLEDVKLTCKDEPAKASCDHVDGTATGFVQPSSCF